MASGAPWRAAWRGTGRGWRSSTSTPLPPTGSPAIAKNQAKTETLVKDGQTLVIGGIYVVRTADRESRVPYFHRVPVIGNAFKIF